MALDTKLVTVATDKNGASVTVKDNTGVYEVSTNPGGYGTPNPDVGDIVKIQFFVEKFGATKLENKVEFDSSSANPSIADIASGTVNVVITPTSLGQVDVKKFADGVLDLTMFTVFTQIEIITTVGSTQVDVVNESDEFPAGIDGLLFDGVPYYIDKTKDNGVQSIFMTKPLDAVYSVAEPFYAAYSKGFVYGDADCCVVGIIGRYAADTCSPQESESMMTMFTYLTAAKTSFNIKDYRKANNLITRINEICLQLKCKC